MLSQLALLLSEVQSSRSALSVVRALADSLGGTVLQLQVAQRSALSCRVVRCRSRDVLCPFGMMSSIALGRGPGFSFSLGLVSCPTVLRSAMSSCC
jgi:hypothetical protein